MTFENFVREHKNMNFDWDNISKNSKLSENFIKEFKHKVNWKKISQFQTLSEQFIEEMKDYVTWDKIAKYQKLSPEFKKVFANKLKAVKKEKTEYYDVNDIW